MKPLRAVLILVLAALMLTAGYDALAAKRKKKKKKMTKKERRALKDLTHTLTLYADEDNEEKLQTLYDKLKNLIEKHGFEMAEKAALAMGSFKPVKTGLYDDKLPGTGAQCVFFVPKGYNPKKSHPLIVGLHRPGQDADVLYDAFFKREIERSPFFIACPTYKKYQWYRKGGVRIIRETVEYMMANYNIDPDKVFLFGYHYGGNGVWHFITHFGDVFAAACAMAGFVRDDALPNAVNTPLLTYYGTLDNTVTLKQGVEWAKRLKDAGGSVEIETVKAKHEVHDMFYRHAKRIFAYFAAHTRKEIPKRVYWKYLKDADRRCHWVGFKAKDRKFEVDARTIGKSRIDLTLKGTEQVILYLSARLVDFSRPLEVYVNGKRVFHDKVPPSADHLIESACDGKFRIYSAVLELDLSGESTKKHPGKAEKKEEEKEPEEKPEKEKEKPEKKPGKPKDDPLEGIP